MSNTATPTNGYASSPCSAHLDPSGVDPAQSRDVARWRKATRIDLLERRKSRSVEDHSAVSQRISDRLERALHDLSLIHI